MYLYYLLCHLKRKLETVSRKERCIERNFSFYVYIMHTMPCRHMSHMSIFLWTVHIADNGNCSKYYVIIYTCDVTKGKAIIVVII